MNRDKARQILTESITNLEKRNGSITQGDLEAEVINNACLAIIKNQNEKIGNGKSIKDLLLGALNSSEDYYPIANAFIDAAKELLPEYFSEEEVDVVTTGIEQNIAWDGMWDFLIDYFKRNHGINIDSSESSTAFFFSERQQKYEGGFLIEDTKNDKTVYISFDSKKEKIIVSIDPDLPENEALLIGKEKKTLRYCNDKNNHIFSINFDEFDEIESFVLDLPYKNTEIIYLEK